MVTSRAKRKSSREGESNGIGRKEEVSVSRRGMGRGSKWLWLVRLCFDRRSRVRVLSLEILGMVLKCTHALPPHTPLHSEGESGSGSDRVVESGVREEYLYSSYLVICSSPLPHIYPLSLP